MKTRITPMPSVPRCTALAMAGMLVAAFGPSPASAAPTAEVAKRCLHYAYILYPHRPPGAAPASGDREAYFRDCLNKNGDVPAPTPPPKKP